MTDRELLELAARAIGEQLLDYCDLTGALLYGVQDRWNPLEDDGDALRLAMKLDIEISPFRDVVSVQWPLPTEGNCTPFASACYSAGTDKAAATRRAIVRAAASLSKTKD